MTIIHKLITSSILSTVFIGISVLPSEATSPSIRPTLNYQIIVDTGGGGGEGPSLPGIRWTFAETPSLKPFIFWGWSVND
jgi:hypothetical protein